MTTLVVITDVPSLGLTVGNIVTDDPAVAAAYPRARLKASAYVAGLLTGNLRRCFVAQDPLTGAPIVPAPSDLLTASLGQAIVQSSPSVGLTPQQLFGLLAAYLTTNGYSVTFQSGGGGGSTAPISPSISPTGFFANVNFQGMDGGDVVPGVVGTNFFQASSDDLAYVKNRANGPSRIPFLWERLQPVLGGPLDQTYLGELKNIADAALALGVQVFFDCHNYMRRISYSQTTTAPFTISGYHGVDNPDGFCTRAHLADMWVKVATFFYGHQGVYGYDLMNEPTDANSFGTHAGQSGSNQIDLPVIMQAVVDAIDAVDPVKVLFVEGNFYSTCKNWVSSNPGYPLIDRNNRIVYSAHCYPDPDQSGQQFSYAQCVAGITANGGNGQQLTATTLVDNSTAFVNWCQANGVRGHIGETNVGVDDVRWLTVLENGLNFWKTNKIGVNLWLFGANFGNNPYNLYPYGGSQIATWGPVQKATGKVSKAVTVSGPNNGTAGQASISMTASIEGYVASDVVFTPSDGGAGGTFSPTSVTIPAGYASAPQSFTYTQAGSKATTITGSATGFSANSFTYSTDAANPVSSYMMASPKFSDWSASNGGLNQNSTYATDATGGNTAARLSDNGSTALHIFNGPASKILADQAFEDQRLLMGSGVRYARVYVTGDSGANFGVDVDMQAGTIVGGVQNNGATLINAAIVPSTNGFKAVRIVGKLAATDTTVRQWVVLENAPGVTLYAGSGADFYMDSSPTFPNAIYVGPIHAVDGPPIAKGAPSIAVTAGSPGVGGTYTATPPAYFNSAPTSLTYRWLRDGTSAISGATSSSYTATSDDTGHTIVPEVTATNSFGSTVTLGTAATIGAPWTVAPNNLVTSQDLSTSPWVRNLGSGTLVVTPNYKDGGFAPDGQSYPTRVQWNGDYNTSLAFATAAHAAGFQSAFFRTNPATGDGPVYINLRSSGADHDLNFDNSSGNSGRAKGAWALCSAPVQANEGWLLLCRGSADFLVWGERVEETTSSTPTPYASPPTSSGSGSTGSAGSSGSSSIGPTVVSIDPSTFTAYNSNFVVNTPYATDPAGGNAASRWADNSGNAEHSLDEAHQYSVVAGKTYGYQAQWMPSSLTAMQFQVYTNDGSNLRVDIDLAAQTSTVVRSDGFTGVVTTITPTSNGFLEVMTKFVPTTATGISFYHNTEKPLGTLNYTGDGSPLYLYQPQFIGPY
jgi:hypothetical protein